MKRIRSGSTRSRIPSITPAVAVVVCLSIIAFHRLHARPPKELRPGMIRHLAGGGALWMNFVLRRGLNSAALAVDDAGRIFVADATGSVRIFEKPGPGRIFAGRNPQIGVPQQWFYESPDWLGSPTKLALDGTGGVFVSDTDGHRVLHCDAKGSVSRIAGPAPPRPNGPDPEERLKANAGFSGDGGPAERARLNQPTGVAVDRSGRLFIADEGNGRIRLIDRSGAIRTIAGGGGIRRLGRPADRFKFIRLHTLVAPAFDGLLACEQMGLYLLYFTPSGRIISLAGDHTGHFRLSQGGLKKVSFVCSDALIDALDQVFIADAPSHRIWKLDLRARRAAVIAGSGAVGPSVGLWRSCQGGVSG